MALMYFTLDRLRKAIRYLRLRPGALPRVVWVSVHNAVGEGLTLAGRRKARCLLCGWRGARFAAYPDVRRIKYASRCPSCDSPARYRLFARYLESTPQVHDPSAVLLEFAPEPASRAYLRRIFKGSYVTADIASPIAQVRTDLMSLGLRSGSIDIVLCSHVLEHLPDDAQGLRELRRIMKPGGWGIFQVPMVSGQPRTEEYGRPNPLEHDHFRRYGEDFPDRLRAAGFVVESVPVRSIATPDQMTELGLPDVPILRVLAPASHDQPAGSAV